ncbi:hypothetical protein TNCV_2106321 [Trichonephila clavipes]|nr:hypothetical protein TNCV_2106321 [Trichonephila clavipes]
MAAGMLNVHLSTIQQSGIKASRCNYQSNFLLVAAPETPLLLLQALPLKKRLVLSSGKVTGVSKVRFQILVPHPENHYERTLHTARILPWFDETTVVWHYLTREFLELD